MCLNFISQTFHSLNDDDCFGLLYLQQNNEYNIDLERVGQNRNLKSKIISALDEVEDLVDPIVKRRNQVTPWLE